MKVEWKDPGDTVVLRKLVQKEGNAKQRDRYRAVLLAGEGLGEELELTREQIAANVGRSRQFVDAWVARYRAGGIESLKPRKQPGASVKLTAGEQQELRAILDAGPPPQEGLAAYNGPVIREKLKERFNKIYSLSGVYALLHRLGYNDLMPRTTHPDTDPAEQEAFKKRSFLSNSSRYNKTIPINAF